MSIQTFTIVPVKQQNKANRISFWKLCILTSAFWNFWLNNWRTCASMYLCTYGPTYAHVSKENACMQVCMYVSARVWKNLCFYVRAYKGVYLDIYVCEIFNWSYCLVCACRFGRRKPLCFYCVIGGVTCISAGVLSNKSGEKIGLRCSERERERERTKGMKK